MAKLTREKVKELTNEWAKLQAKITRAEAARNAEIDPYLVEFNERTEPIRARHDTKILSLRTQADEIEAKVLGWLNGVGKPIALDADAAVAANETVVGKRVISVQQFFDRVKERSAAFWDCVSVGVAKAEKLIGKTAVDEISMKETKLVASLKLK